MAHNLQKVCTHGDASGQFHRSSVSVALVPIFSLDRAGKPQTRHTSRSVLIFVLLSLTESASFDAVVGASKNAGNGRREMSQEWC